MIRNFVNGSSQPTLHDVLSQFQIATPKYISVLKFEALTPDSFTWQLLIDNNVYYLYAEDYVPGLAYIKDVFSKLIRAPGWALIKAKQQGTFEAASPVTRASTYKKAADADDMMAYAVPSGYDFVFLAKSSEDPKDIDSVVMTT